MKLNCVYSIVECFICMGSIVIKHMDATSHCHFERSEAESRNLRSNSFLSIWHTLVLRRTGNYSQIVSYSDESHQPHVEQETFRKQFPIGMIHIAATSHCHFERSEAESRNLRSV